MSGEEDEKVAVCVGQKVCCNLRLSSQSNVMQAINERIQELEFQECKVRVTNVDSQGSGPCIVIQVIGEMSIKKLPSRKFVQTFVLAEQKTGYFVLNDIFRLIIEEDDGEPVETADDAPADTTETTGGRQEAESSVQNTAVEMPINSNDLHEVVPSVEPRDHVAKENVVPETEPTVSVSNHVPETAETKDDPAFHEEAPLAATNISEPEPVDNIISSDATPIVEETKQVDPEPTASVEDPPSAVETQSTESGPAPAKPEAPKTWAKMVAGNKVVPAVASTSAPAPPPISTVSAAPPTKSSAAPITPSGPAALATATPPDSDQVTPQSSGSEWQMAGHEHSRKQSRGQASQVPIDNSRGYIKNVVPEIEFDELRMPWKSSVRSTTLISIEIRYAPSSLVEDILTKPRTLHLSIG